LQDREGRLGHGGALDVKGNQGVAAGRGKPRHIFSLRLRDESVIRLTKRLAVAEAEAGLAPARDRVLGAPDLMAVQGSGQHPAHQKAEEVDLTFLVLLGARISAHERATPRPTSKNSGATVTRNAARQDWPYRVAPKVASKFDAVAFPGLCGRKQRSAQFWAPTAAS